MLIETRRKRSMEKEHLRESRTRIICTPTDGCGLEMKIHTININLANCHKLEIDL